MVSHCQEELSMQIWISSIARAEWQSAGFTFPSRVGYRWGMELVHDERQRYLFATRRAIFDDPASMR